MTRSRALSAAAPSFAIVIPAYDCAATIEGAVAGALGHPLPVVVVDDGSTDQTASVAERAGATVLRNRRNLGKGESLRRGLRHCREQGFSHAVSMDGDGQHLPDQIPVLIAAAVDHPNSIVVGQRIIDPSTVSASRLFGNRFANRWVEIACHEAIPDTQSGFRVYPVEATLALSCRARRFAFETEVLIRAVRHRLSIVSIPIEVYYPPPEVRTSHFRPWVDTVRIIFVVLGLIFRVYRRPPKPRAPRAHLRSHSAASTGRWRLYHTIRAGRCRRRRSGRSSWRPSASQRREPTP